VTGSWRLRLQRSQDHYGIGTAVQASTGQGEGFLAFLSDADQVLATRPLICNQADGTSIHLYLPYALAVRRPGPGLRLPEAACDTCAAASSCAPTAALCTTVVVVGSGSLLAADGTTVLLQNQAIIGTVVVSGCVMEEPTLFLGLGDVWGAAPSVSGYTDLVWSPYENNVVFVCGYANSPTPPYTAHAGVASVDVTTGTALQGLLLSDVATTTFGVSIVNAPPGLVTIGVNDFAPDANDALLWTVTAVTGGAPFASVAPFPSVLNTQYNDPSTSRLRRPDHATALKIIRVVAHVCNGIMVVACATMDAGGGTPSKVLVVYAFDGATSPIASFGTLGALTWWVPDGGTTSSTQPTDAVLVPDGGLVVVGNAFPSGTENFDGFPVSARGVGVPPRPFAVQVKSCSSAWCCCCCGGGAPPNVALLVSDLPGCAYARFATSAFLSNPKCLHITGDVFPHGCGVPAQQAGVLHAIVSLACPVRVVNNGPCAGYCRPKDGGPARIDYACASNVSTLIVAGPVVVGSVCPDAGTSSALPIPGSLMFDPVARKFLGYDGTSWLPLAWEAPT
jgi:hypothetical protein